METAKVVPMLGIGLAKNRQPHLALMIVYNEERYELCMSYISC